MSASEEDDLTAYVEVLLQLGGLMSLILNHMSSYPSAPDADPFDDVLRRMIRGVLEQPTGKRPTLELPAATATLEETIRTIGSEVLLVDPHGLDMPDDEVREARRRRRKLPMPPRRPI